MTRVTSLERVIRSLPNVAATAPFIETLAMCRTSTFLPCQLRGIQFGDDVGDPITALVAA